MTRSRSTRRDFLKGKSILQAIRDTVQHVVADPANQPPDEESIENRELHQEHYLEHFSKSAMACQFELLFNLHQYPQAAAVAMKAFELIDQLESRLTVYREDSEVSQLNNSSRGVPVPISPPLQEILRLAEVLSIETNGAFDITASLLTRLWGFDRRAGNLPTQAQIQNSLAAVDYTHVQLDTSASKVALLNDCQINLGGIGKGFALDEVAQFMEQEQINHWILHGGQSSVLAHGDNFQTETQDNGWSVGLSHPTLPNYRLGQVTLRNQALGTSGTARQSFVHQGKRYGHIIDPRTGWPTSHCLSTTVVCSSAATCDALATAFFVMQPEDVEAYCRKHTDVGAILVLPGDDQEGLQKVELIWFNLDDKDFSRT